MAHFHYVMMGGTLIAFLGGLHYWWPKMFGRMYNENLARIACLIIFVGFNATFFPQFVLGSRGMPRRYANYDAGFAYIGGSASFIRATYRPEYDDGISNLARGLTGIALAPKMKLSLDGGVRVWDQKITLGARMTHVTPDDETTVEESKPGDPPPTRFFDYWRYTVVDLYANAKVTETFTIRASLENIRNVAYIDALGNPLTASPGRTFTIGATARF